MNRRNFQNGIQQLTVLFFSISGSMTLLLIVTTLIEGIRKNPVLNMRTLWYLSLILTGVAIIVQFVESIFASENTDTRKLSIVYGGYFGLICILGKILKGIVSPLYILFGSGLCAIFITTTKPLFNQYNKFVDNTEGLTGKALTEKLNEANWLVSDFVTTGNKITFAYTVVSCIMITGTTTLFLTRIPIHPGLYISELMFLLSFAFLIIQYHIYRQESSFAFRGYSGIFLFRNRILAVCLCVCAISMLVGLICSSDTAIIKWSYITWLFSLLKRPVSYQQYQYEMTPPPAQDLNPLKEALEGAGGHMEATPLGIIIGYILQAAGYAILSVFAIVIVVKFFGPLFSLKWKRFWKENHLGMFMKTAWKNIRQFIFDLFHPDKRIRHSYNTAEAFQFQDKLRDLLKATKKSKEKRAELDTLTTEFMKLIDAGTDIGVHYEPHMAPAEFTRLLADQLSTADDVDKPPVTSMADAVLTAGRLFEQALYAKELLTKEERTQFEESIQTVCR